ncbi:MAG TPA: Grx4 family monothiol glutaredoxin [Rhodanobacteraceae bacterium]|nr:Grx4 family monothiol glutaredoxin [Rhodanobacteraceae bacterium]
MSLAPEVRTRIETLLHDNRVVLFMKGNPGAPRCGFSAAASGLLNELLPDYATVDVLEDAEIREGIKAYGNWPTIPQLYVGGELVGGSDIIQSMYTSGELQQLFGLPKPDRTPPPITITDKAAAEIRNAMADAEAGLALHLAIDARFQAQFHLAEAELGSIRSEANGIAIYMDLATAQRARNVRIDWADTVQGSGLTIDNPNAPAGVKALSVQDLKTRLDSGDITLIDVRPPDERALAALTAPFRTLDDGIEALARLPKDTQLAFLCHTGSRSASAAEHFRGLGFAKVYNVAGGIDAWSREVDPGVPRY